MNVLKIENNSLIFFCPGCKITHIIRYKSDGNLGPVWSWNEDLISPTINPSILVRYPYGDPPVAQVCHSFIKNGNIEFLEDCTHGLSGVTVKLQGLN